MEKKTNKKAGTKKIVKKVATTKTTTTKETRYYIVDNKGNYYNHYKLQARKLFPLPSFGKQDLKTNYSAQTIGRCRTILAMFGMQKTYPLVSKYVGKKFSIVDGAGNVIEKNLIAG